jgi:hypothetical protein
MGMIPNFQRKGNYMPNDVLKIVQVVDFTARKHVHQRRKGANQEPHFNHASEVARILGENTHGPDVDLIIAGFLHDTIEDTDTSYDELVAKFGEVVGDLVQESTDDHSLLKQVRKQLQIEKAPKKSDRAKQLKIADKISNLSSLLHSPPVDWDKKRKLDYAEWANNVVAGCKGINPKLDTMFDEIYNEAIGEFRSLVNETHIEQSKEIVQLENPVGDYLKISIEGYQYPDSDYEYYDSNWLLINGELSHQGSKYQFTDPCLLTRDVAELSDWLDHVANGTVKDPRIGFVEPNLEFEVMAENKIRISTWVMASPVHPHTGPED